MFLNHHIIELLFFILERLSYCLEQSPNVSNSPSPVLNSKPKILKKNDLIKAIYNLFSNICNSNSDCSEYCSHFFPIIIQQFNFSEKVKLLNVN